ncbi:MAG: DUF4388 domain-containing protein [Acidimicrobiia bacterium]
MSLQGTLDTFDLADVLHLLERGRKSGALDVRADGTGCVLSLCDGQFVDVAADWAPSLGSGADGEAVLVEVCATLLRLDSGAFRFDEASDPATAGLECYPVGPIVDAARLRAEEWRQLETLIPSLDAPVIVVPELPVESVVVDRSTWRMLAALDGRRSVRDLARDLGRPVPAVGREVADLYRQRMVVFYESQFDAVVLPESAPVSSYEPQGVPVESVGAIETVVVAELPGPTAASVPAWDAVADDGLEVAALAADPAEADELRRDRGALLRMFSSLKE